jgi:hypothetical protein
MSGMAMLQQMLPGVNLTYGTGGGSAPAALPQHPPSQPQKRGVNGDIWGGGGGSIW